jgi:hypothetical protein
MATRRLELGFDGGTVLRLTVQEGVSEALTGGLTASDGPAWRSIEAEEGTFWISEKDLRYVRLAPGEVPGRVGFGGT